MTQLNHLLTTLPDTRPYPEAPTKNELLRYAAQIADHTSAAQERLAQEQLAADVTHMLAQNHYLSLSVALSMVQSPAQYRVLWQTLCDALSAHQDTEVQWLAFPLVLVIGADEAGTLNATIPAAALKKVLAQHPTWQAATAATWLPQLLSAETLSQIAAGDWYAAKQNREAAAAFAETLAKGDVPYSAGQSVIVAYALCYGDATLHTAAGKNFSDAALPLMQVWQEHLTTDGLTVFVNPLAGEVPAAAQTTGSAMRQRMACDVFTANAVRSIRLQSPRVAVVAATREGGQWIFSFQSHDEDALPPLNFTWQLAPAEEIPLVLQNFFDLLAECRIEHVRVLQEVLAAHETVPSYQQALQRKSFNPFLADDA